MNVRTTLAQAYLVAAVAAALVSPPVSASAKTTYGCTVPALPSTLTSKKSAAAGKSAVTTYAACLNRSVAKLQYQQGSRMTGAISARLYACKMEVMNWDSLAQPHYPGSVIPTGPKPPCKLAIAEQK
jgi:hypothetical protein